MSTFKTRESHPGEFLSYDVHSRPLIIRRLPQKFTPVLDRKHADGRYFEIDPFGDFCAYSVFPKCDTVRFTARSIPPLYIRAGFVFANTVNHRNSPINPYRNNHRSRYDLLSSSRLRYRHSARQCHQILSQLRNN